MQYVEGVSGETARRSRVSTLVAEALMNNAGKDGTFQMDHGHRVRLQP